MTTLKITQIGNSLGVILPKEVLAILNADKGDTLFVTRTPDGVVLSAYDAKIANQIEVGRRIMRENREALRRLAE
jgi:putative addiction module antidote